MGCPEGDIAFTFGKGLKTKNRQVYEKCNLCQRQKVVELAGFSELRRVTSDCQVWKNNGRLGICKVCGGIQKIVDQVWLSEIEQIYQDYSIYHQGGGIEQSVFDPVSGQPTPRSELLFRKFASRYGLPERGRLLDVGCGNGAFLRVFSKVAPRGWSLSGIDLNNKHIENLKRIEHFEELYTCDLSLVTGFYDMISMIYVLEHVVDPKVYIKNVRNKLNPNGYLLVEVPDYYQNPFDLLIADHCTHFTFQSLTTFLERSGFEGGALVLPEMLLWLQNSAPDYPIPGQVQ